MAELDVGANGTTLDAEAMRQTDQDGPQMTQQDDGASPEERFTDELPSDANDPQFRYWQAAYTRTRQRDRERYNTLEGEHQQFGDVLRNFYTSDEYALQVLRQRFPQLAHRLTLDGTPAAAQGTRAAGDSAASPLVGALEQELGPDLAFLAPRLGPVLERAITRGLEAAMTPYQQRTEQQQAAARQREEGQLLAGMDAQYPGWEPRFGAKMKALDDFLNSDELTHPEFGNKYELLLRLVHPDLARVDAARSMGQAARSRVTTGRTGSPSQPNTDEQIRGAKTNSEAFRLAAEAALRELGGRG